MLFLENFSFRVVFSKTPMENWHPSTDGYLVSSKLQLTWLQLHSNTSNLFKTWGVFQPPHPHEETPVHAACWRADRGLSTGLQATEFQSYCCHPGKTGHSKRNEEHHFWVL